ncbi:hypothetical protein IKN40_00090 [bacterium]|nr:hypothetical protein [bacterium]
MVGFFVSSLKYSQDNDVAAQISALAKKYYRMEEISYILEKEYYDDNVLV